VKDKAGVWANRLRSVLTVLSGRWWLLPTLSFMALGAVCFRYYAPALFYRYDGTFILTTAVTQQKWLAPGIGFSLNLLEGLGDIWIPTATSLVSGFLVGNLLGDAQSMPVIACFIFAIEFFLSTLVLAQCLGANQATSLSAAWIGALFTLPFFVPTLAAWRLWGNPHFMETIAVTSLTLSAYLYVGKAGWKRDAMLLVVIAALLAVMIGSQPVRAVIAAVTLACFGIAAIVAARGRTERLRKLVVAAAVVLGFGAAFGGYVFALFYYARTTYFWSDIAAFPINWKQQSFVSSESGAWGPYLWGACLVGAALAGWRERGRLQLFALAFLLFVAVQVLLLLAGQFTRFSWSGPTSAYFDMFALPLYALFAAYLVVGWWSVSQARQRAVVFAASAVVPWPAVLALHHPYANLPFHQQNPFLWPPQATPITRLLQDEIGLTPGGPFRGRVANLAGAAFEPQYDWVPVISQHDYDSAVSYYAGNDHRYYGLWYFNIPTLIEDNQFSSPFSHVINSRLLSGAAEKHVRQLTTVTRFEPRILAMLGVRFVISGAPIAGLTARRTLVVVPERPDIWTLHLYELANANTAGYWATKPVEIATTRQAMLWMAAPGGGSDAAVYEPLPSMLVTGTSSELDVFRDHLVVRADSPGTSLLVLPVEFSHCFDVKLSTPGPTHMLRANVNQIAFLFAGRLDAELRYRYSPWHFGCRLRDIDDAQRLKLSAVGWPP
jgi:hypothetical protein